MASAIKNILGVNIISKEIECADTIVEENGIYRAVLVSARASECFFIYIEVERFSTLLVTLQSRKGKGLWFGYSTVN